MSGKWELLAKKVHHKSKWRSLEEWTMKTHNGKEYPFDIIIGKDIVIVFGITDDNNVLVIEEYFISSRKRVFSLVGGIIDKENIEQSAIDELRQEAGCVAKEMICLGSFLRGKYMTGSVYIFLAKGVEKKYEQDLEYEEDISASFVPLKEFKKFLKDGKVEPVYEIACAYRALDYLGKL